MILYQLDYSWLFNLCHDNVFAAKRLLLLGLQQGSFFLSHTNSIANKYKIKKISNPS